MEKPVILKLLRRLSIIAVVIMALFLTACGKRGGGDNRTDEETAASGAKSSGTAQRAGGKENEEKAVPLKELQSAVAELLGDGFWPDQDMEKEEFETETGITEKMYVEYLAQKQSVGTSIDTLIIIRAKEDAVGDVEQALNTYREAQLEKWKDRPQDLAKAEASRIETINDYVCYVQLGADTTAASEKGDDQVIALCQEANERAIDVIEKSIRE